MGGTISSSSKVAQQLVTGISRSVQEINYHEITTANQTTVQGNNLAKLSIESENDLISVFKASLLKDLENVSSIANEFESLNHKISNKISARNK